MTAATLLRDGHVLAPLEIATSLPARTRGLLGRDHLDGALLLTPASSVHTFGMRFDLDVAFCDRDLVVLRTARLRRNRLTRVVWHARSVVEALAGSFDSWGLRPGDRLAVSR